MIDNTKLTETDYKIKTLREEIITVKENTPEGQKRLKEIEAELNNLNKGLLHILSNVGQDQ